MRVQEIIGSFVQVPGSCESDPLAEQHYTPRVAGVAARHAPHAGSEFIQIVWTRYNMETRTRTHRVDQSKPEKDLYVCTACQKDRAKPGASTQIRNLWQDEVDIRWASQPVMQPAGSVHEWANDARADPQHELLPRIEQ